MNSPVTNISPSTQTTLVKVRETPGTWLYKEETVPGHAPKVRNIYLGKATVAALGMPTEITVTIQAGRHQRG